MKPSSVLLTLSLFLLSSASDGLMAELKFGRHFSDHMVLQRDKSVLIRGYGPKGSSITVEFSGQSKETKADELGAWSVSLDPMPASSEGKALRVSSSTENHKAELKDVVVGDVLVFARQTTVDISLGGNENAVEATESLPSARVMNIHTIPVAEPQIELAKESTQGWKILDKEVALKMDSAAFFMLKEMESHEVPVGVMSINMGRHFPIAWMSKKALLASNEVFQERGNQVIGMIKMMEGKKKKYEEVSKNPELRNKRRAYPLAPAELDARYPSAGYNAVLHPLQGLAMKALFLQLGNNYPYYPYANLEKVGKDTSRAHASQAFDECYDVRKWCLYLAPITTPRIPKEWRESFGDPTLPIAWITPPGSPLDTLGKHHREMRELMRQAVAKESGVDLIFPGSESIALSAQPKDQVLLGKRCLTWLKESVFKEDEKVGEGPIFEKVELKGDTALVSFKPGTALGLKSDEEGLNYFEVAAATESDNPNIAPNHNLEYVKADAKIEGEKIRLQSNSVSKIAYVRYNWREIPDQSLTNQNGLPAFPFTTDGVAFPRRILSNEEKKPAEFFMSIVDWESEGPVIYDGELQTGPSAGKAQGPTGIIATGAFGRNLFVNNTFVGSPAEGKLFHGDYIYGVNGKPFGQSVWKDMAEAIVLAETEKAEGVMKLEVLRKGNKMTVEIQLPVLGTYSETSPYDCPKTDRLIAEAEAQIAKRGGPKGDGGRAGVVYSNPEAMFLLAAGSPQYQGLVRRHVYAIMAKRDLSIEIDPLGKTRGGGGPWDNSANMLLLSEYYLATGDKNVLPYLKHMCDALTSIQIRHPDDKGPWPKVQNLGQMGGWRHNFYGGAAYGTMPAIGVPAVLGYHLTKEAGVEYNFIGYDRAVHWFYHNGAQIGNFIYGYFAEPRTKRGRPLDPDQLAAGKLSPGNGGVAGAAILYDLIGNEKIAKINSHVATHTYNNTGYAHGGHFWANFYGPLGAKVDSDESFQFFMKGYRNYKTMTRMPNFSREWGYGYYLADVAPRERLRILGAHESVFGPNAPKALTASLEHYYQRNYSESERAVKAVIAKGMLKGLDLKKAEQLRDAASLLQESIAMDLAKVKKLIAEQKPFEAGLDIAQLKGVMPEESSELSDIEMALAEKELKNLIRNDQKRYKESIDSHGLKLTPEIQEEGQPWQEIVSQSPGRHFAIKSKGTEPTSWRMKVIESLEVSPQNWTAKDYDDDSWGEVVLPINWRENHTILLRTTFDIADPDSVAGLRFNQYAKHLRNMQVFLNGEPVAKISAVSGGRTVSVPLNDHALKLLKKGSNTLSATYKNNLRWGGRGRADGGGLNITMEMQTK